MAKTPVVRVLGGALKGCVVAVGRRLEIGRASNAGLQLLDASVSRIHAAIAGQDDGRYALIDLLSTNGSYVGSERVSNEPLATGTRFRVGDCELLFELADVAEVVEAFDPVVSDGSDTKTRTDLLAVGTSNPLPPTPSEGTPSRVVTTATAPVLGDIILVRNLRPAIARSSALPDGLRREYEAAWTRLRVRDESADERGFARFAVDIPGKVQFDGEPGVTHPIHLREVGVDIGKTTMPGRTVRANERCSVTLPVMTADGLRSVVFRSRVVSAVRDVLELGFVGAPVFRSTQDKRASLETGPIAIERRVDRKPR